MIITGTIVAFGPGTIWLLTSPLHLFEFTPYLFLPIVLFPLTLGYTILRFRLLRADDWVRQGVIYFLLWCSSWAVMPCSLRDWGDIQDGHAGQQPFWIGGLVFVLAILLDPIRLRLQTFVDNSFFRGQRAYAESVQNFTHALTGTLDLDSIGQVLRQQIISTLIPNAMHIFTYDLPNDQYVSLPDEDNRASTDIQFSSESPLADYFITERLPLYLDLTALPASLKPEQARLTLLGAHLFIAMRGHDRPVGWLAFGPRLSGQPYTPRDLVFLENLADTSFCGHPARADGCEPGAARAGNECPNPRLAGGERHTDLRRCARTDLCTDRADHPHLAFLHNALQQRQRLLLLWFCGGE